MLSIRLVNIATLYLLLLTRRMSLVSSKKKISPKGTLYSGGLCSTHFVFSYGIKSSPAFVEKGFVLLLFVLQ